MEEALAGEKVQVEVKERPIGRLRGWFPRQCAVEKVEHEDRCMLRQSRTVRRTSIDENMMRGNQLCHIRIPKVSCIVYSCKIYCILFIQFINISARRQCNSNYYIFIEASLNSNWHPEEASS